VPGRTSLAVPSQEERVRSRSGPRDGEVLGSRTEPQATPRPEPRLGAGVAPRAPPVEAARLEDGASDAWDPAFANEGA
jgi:hypothetical protein